MPRPFNLSVCPVLEPGGTVANTRPRDGRHLDLAAEHRLVEGDRHLDDDVVALALEHGMRLDPDLDQRVAGLALADAGIALALEPQHLAVGDACGNGDVERARRRAA